MSQESFKSRADMITSEVDVFIATVKFPSDRVRCDSVVLVLDGADDGAHLVYAALAKVAPSTFPATALPRDKILTVVCPYGRLKECAKSAGYVIGAEQDKDPASTDVRVATFTDGGVLVATYRLVHPVGQA